MTGIEGLLERSRVFERGEDERLLREVESLESGSKDSVVKGLHDDFLKLPENGGEEESGRVEEIFHDLRDARVVNTWLYEAEESYRIKQDRVPKSFYQAMLDQGLEHAVRETVKVFESFVENGYTYCDLSPDNIRFWKGRGIAVDYLDNQAVERIEGDPEIPAVISYDLFAQELSSSVPGLSKEEIEGYIAEYSTHVDPGIFEEKGLTGSLINQVKD